MFLDKVDRLARNAGVGVAALDGNHDNWSPLLATYTERDDDGSLVVRERVRYAPRAHRWTWGRSRCLALGGAASLDKEWRLRKEAELTAKAAGEDHFRQRSGAAAHPTRDYAGTLWFPDEELTDADVARALSPLSGVDLMLTHDKPRWALPAYDRKDVPEAWPNQDRVQAVVEALQPDRLVHGHLHVRYTDRVGGTLVDGLACDPVAGAWFPGYRREDSWLVVDL